MVFISTSLHVATTKTGLYMVLGVLCGFVFLYNDRDSPLYLLHTTLTTLWMWALFAVLVAVLVTVLPLLMLAAYLDGPDYFLGTYPNKALEHLPFCALMQYHYRKADYRPSKVFPMQQLSIDIPPCIRTTSK